MSYPDIIIGTAGWGGGYGRSGQCEDLDAIVQACADYEFHDFDTSPEYRFPLSCLSGTHGTVYVKVGDSPWETLAALGKAPVFLRHNAKPKTMIPHWCSGISVYAADLPEWTMIPKGIVQVDWSPLHRQAANIFARDAQDGIRVHLRSIFLQGALMGNLDGVPRDLHGPIEIFRRVADYTHEDPAFLAFAMAMAQPVDAVVIGANNLKDIERLDDYRTRLGKADLAAIRALIHLIPSCYVDPRLWTSPSSRSIQATAVTVNDSTTSSENVSITQIPTSAIKDSPSTGNTASSSPSAPTSPGASSRKGKKRSGPST